MKNKRSPLFLLFVSLLAGLSFCQAQGQKQTPEQAPLKITPAITRTVIDSLGETLKHNYVFPDTAAKMWAYLDKEFKRGAYTSIHDPQELANRLLADLQKAHHDGHLRFHYNPGMAEAINRDRTDTNGLAERRRTGMAQAVIQMKKQNFAFSNAEILNGNIGYVKFNGFVGFVDQARPTFTAAFKFVANTDALIIDMRDNGGGSPEMVCVVASYFFPDRHHWNDIVGPQGNHEFYVEPSKADNLTLSMPVYILTSRQTFSGGEDFCYGLQSLHRATIIGDTTGGGAHPVGPVPVVMGFVADIPFARSLNPYTHTDWEGTGVRPDVPVNSALALGKVQQIILTDRANNAKTDDDKMRAQWLLEELTAKQSPQTPAAPSLSAYTGTFRGGLVFYLDHGDLYCKNRERGGYVSKLISLSGDKFILDENVHIEFKKDDKGSYQQIVMHFSDGRSVEKPREQ